MALSLCQLFDYGFEILSNNKGMSDQFRTVYRFPQMIMHFELDFKLSLKLNQASYG